MVRFYSQGKSILVCKTHVAYFQNGQALSIYDKLKMNSRLFCVHFLNKRRITLFHNLIKGVQICVYVVVEILFYIATLFRHTLIRHLKVHVGYKEEFILEYIHSLKKRCILCYCWCIATDSLPRNTV